MRRRRPPSKTGFFISLSRRPVAAGRYNTYCLVKYKCKALGHHVPQSFVLSVFITIIYTINLPIRYPLIQVINMNLRISEVQTWNKFKTNVPSTMLKMLTWPPNLTAGDPNSKKKHCTVWVNVINKCGALVPDKGLRWLWQTFKHFNIHCAKRRPITLCTCFLFRELIRDDTWTCIMRRCHQLCWFHARPTRPHYLLLVVVVLPHKTAGRTWTKERLARNHKQGCKSHQLVHNIIPSSFASFTLGSSYKGKNYADETT